MFLPAHVRQSIAKLGADKTNGRSFFVYDLTVMKAKIAALKAALPQEVGIFYAMKANPNGSFLKAALAADVAGVEIASIGEGRKALDAGFAPKQIVFTGPGKSPEELEWAVSTGIKLVHVESLTEAHRLEQICARQGVTQEILVRVNPNFHVHDAQASFSGDSSKFGIDQELYFGQLPQIAALPHLAFRGLHVYSASGVLQLDDLLENCRRVFELARETEARVPGLKCSTIDFGGGFGIDYLETGRGFQPEAYAARLTALIAEHGFAGRHFVLELGRYLTADSGWYCTEIVDIKTSVGMKQIVCQGGSHHFRRPIALKINHPVDVVRMDAPAVFDGQQSVRNETAFIGGALCNSADKLTATPVHLEAADIGDLFVVGLAGAYGYSMSHLDFLSHPRPLEIVIAE